MSEQNRTRRINLWYLLQVVGGIAAFGFLFWSIPWVEAGQALREASIPLLLLTVISIVVVHLWTWTSHVYLMKIIGKPQPTPWFFKTILITQVAGMLAPGKVGDLTIALILRKRGIAYGEGLAVGIFYKVVALLITLWLGMLGLAGWLGSVQALWLLIVLPCVLLPIPQKAGGWLIRLVQRRISFARLAGEMGTFHAAWNRLSALRPLTTSLLLALVKALLMTITPWLTLIALGQEVSFLLVLALAALIRLVSAIPISPSGLGVRELSGTMLFSEWADVPWAIAANAMLVSTLLTYVLGVVAYLYGCSVLTESTIDDQTS